MKQRDLKLKLERFFRNKYNLMFLGVIILAFILRLIYYNVNSALWWDEATYLDTAKYWAFGKPYWAVEAARPPFFMLFMALFFWLGLGEIGVRFFTVLIPSLGVVIMTYLLGKEMYNRRIGLIASFIMAVFWVLLFNTGRVHSDALAMFFSLLAIYFFWKGYVKPEKKNTLYIFLVGLFFGLSFLTRLATFVAIFIVLLFLIITEGLTFLKNKNLLRVISMFILILVPYMIFGYFHFGNLFPWLQQYFTGVAGNAATKSFAWDLLGYVQLYTFWVFFIVFIIGLITLLDLFFGFDLILKRKSKKFYNDLFVIIAILFTLAVYIFIFRVAEPRYMLIMAPFMFFIIAKGFILIYNKVKVYNKLVALLFILILLAFGAYSQINYTKDLVNSRKDTYIQFRIAGEWLKENTNNNDVIFANGDAELIYYSERTVVSFPGTESEFEEMKAKLNPKYMVLSVLEKSPDWSYDYPLKFNETIVPVQAYYLDSEQTQVGLVIYQFLE